MIKLNEQQTEELLRIITQAVDDFTELGHIRQDYAGLRKFPLGKNCSSFRSVVQQEVSHQIDALTEHRLGFFLADLDNFLSKNGLKP